MINAWYFSIPSGNDDLLAKIAERKRILNRKKRGMIANRFLYLLSTIGYRKKEKSLSLNYARGRTLSEEIEL